MPDQVKSQYLVCTKNRGLQRKHIAVCKRCSGNHDCREYQEYLRMEPVVAEPMKPIQKAVTLPMSDLIEQLAEIRQLVGGTTSDYRLHRQAGATYKPGASWNQFLRAELKAIRSICQFNNANPAAHHLNARKNMTNR